MLLAPQFPLCERGYRDSPLKQPRGTLNELVRVKHVRRAVLEVC